MATKNSGDQPDSGEVLLYRCVARAKPAPSTGEAYANVADNSNSEEKVSTSKEGKNEKTLNTVYILLGIIAFLVAVTIYVNNIKNKADNNEKMIVELKKEEIKPLRNSVSHIQTKLHVLDNKVSNIKENLESTRNNKNNK